MKTGSGAATAVAAHAEPIAASGNSVHVEPIAIVGMRGRFPGANDLDTYWKNLSEGAESIAVLSQEEMRAAGVPDSVSRLPGYVNASPVLDGIDQFDAEFFGFSARDASLTDPQHRLFLETAWEALEDAGYNPDTYDGSIGVFGGTWQLLQTPTRGSANSTPAALGAVTGLRINEWSNKVSDWFELVT